MSYGDTDAAKVSIGSFLFLDPYPACLLLYILILSSKFCLFSINTAESAFKHTKRTHEVVNEMGTKHISASVSLIRFVVD